MTGSVSYRDGPRGRSWFYTIDLGRDPLTGKRRQKVRRGFATKKAATVAMQTELVKRREGSFVDPSGEPLADYLDRWLTETADSRATSTNHNYGDHVARIVRHLGTVPLGQLGNWHVQSAYRAMLTDAAPTTIRTTHTVLHAALEQAVRWRLLPANPADHVTLPKVATVPLAIWTEAQARTFLAATDGTPDGPLWRFYLDSGCRRGEALALMWDSVDLDAGTVRIHRTLSRDRSERYALKEGAKHGSDRTIALAGKTLDALERQRECQMRRKREAVDVWRDLGIVFDRGDGWFFDATVISRRFDAASKRAGVPRIQMKALRHTSATIAVANGVPLNVLKDRLGHSTIRLTADLYSHATREADETAMLILDRVLNQSAALALEAQNS